MLWQRLQAFFHAKFGNALRTTSASVPSSGVRHLDVFSPQALSRSWSCGMYTDMHTPANKAARYAELTVGVEHTVEEATDRMPGEDGVTSAAPSAQLKESARNPRSYMSRACKTRE
ncbi:hypothetical protein SPRG_05154 [Saprolegnia parasitica CBS 223.65]|uniref:Uncharacterized protein n=1 Tax=Saprolegnia parasitica (strain CBS 223.65) TaxID=695850 RepID=A0A067CGS5_SAPPC|nr:hypothetical protein SPRG_05154 [Saprolegnia parasitica CBS 223.65]KDO29964.1 hypothetical protein SPRG_05154 [Saprolegnia parasitica CBS 223.65]|eukprot:XP_012199148.1 hypothetical protein SPRG_05154 [Saprolegnia parasitica CBS 223.65]